MAKMKVHELAKELERQSKELVAFLQDKGYEVKAAQSSVEEEAIALVRKQFGGKSKDMAKGSAESGKETASATASRQDTAARAESGTGTSREEIKPATPKAGVKAEAVSQGKTEGKAPTKQNADARRPENGRGETPKKKKIIFVSNPQHSKMQGQGQRPAQGQGSNHAGRRNNNDRDRDRRQPSNGARPVQVQNAPHKIIRPTQKPIPVTAEPYEVRQRQQQERRLEQRQQEKRKQKSR